MVKCWLKDASSGLSFYGLLNFLKSQDTVVRQTNIQTNYRDAEKHMGNVDKTPYNLFLIFRIVKREWVTDRPMD